MPLRPLDGIAHALLPALPARTALFAVAIDLIPLLLGRLEKARLVGIWDVPQDKVTGRNLLGEQALALLQPIESIDNLYRWFEANYRGTVYAYETIDGVNVITPPIPIVPAPTDAPLLPVLARLGEVTNLFVTGSDVPIALLTDMTLAARLQLVIAAINDNTGDNTDVINELISIAALLA